jgi:lipopolysaccharide transport system permease protein
VARRLDGADGPEIISSMIESIAPAPASAAAELIAPDARPLNPRVFSEIVVHLVRREMDAEHRMTILGWAWPLVRQLAQLATLVFIFGSVINLHIPHFPVYVFSGLVSWTWFSTGIGSASTALLSERHLVFQPRFPSIVLPIVAITVPLVDVALALPVLLILASFEGGLHWTLVLLPALVVLQFFLMAGLAWLVASLSVFFRDIPNLVIVALQVIFYMSPVFYRLKTVSSHYSRYLKFNPMATVIDGYRAVLLGDVSPSVARFLYVGGVGAVLLVVGLVVFRRQAPSFVDSL